MFRMHAVWRCPSCGYKTDCCGWQSTTLVPSAVHPNDTSFIARQGEPVQQGR